MRFRFTNLLLSVLITTFSISLLLSCVNFQELNQSALPKGFDESETFVHAANLGLYVGSDAQINSFLQVGKGVPIESLEIRAKSIPDDLAVRVKLRGVRGLEVFEATKGFSNNFYGNSIKIDDNRSQVMLINNQSEWSKQASELWAAGNIENRVIDPELRELLSLLPQNPSSEIQAIGYVRNLDTLAGDVLGTVSRSIEAVDGVLDFLRSRLIVAAGYGEINSINWDELTENQKFLGIIAITRSTYPGFLTEIICDRFFEGLSFEKANLHGNIWHTLEKEEGFHVMAKCQEDLMYLVFTIDKNKSLILSEILNFNQEK